MNALFRDFAEQKTHLEALSVQVLQEGAFSCPAEGKLATLPPATVIALCEFLRGMELRLRDAAAAAEKRAKGGQAPGKRAGAR